MVRTLFFSQMINSVICANSQKKPNETSRNVINSSILTFAEDFGTSQ